MHTRYRGKFRLSHFLFARRLSCTWETNINWNNTAKVWCRTSAFDGGSPVTWMMRCVAFFLLANTPSCIVLYHWVISNSIHLDQRFPCKFLFSSSQQIKWRWKGYAIVLRSRYLYNQELQQHDMRYFLYILIYSIGLRALGLWQFEKITGLPAEIFYWHTWQRICEQCFKNSKVTISYQHEYSCFWAFLTINSVCRPKYSRDCPCPLRSFCIRPCCWTSSCTSNTSRSIAIR